MTKSVIISISLVSLVVVAIPWIKPPAQGQTISALESLPGLRQKVTVVRDEYGVPHVTASSDHDAYFMMGYVQAQDRFFEMDLARRQGSGTLAEMLGAGPNDQFLLNDIQTRIFGVNRAAERSTGAYSAEAAALIQAYSDGVNAWLENNPLPPEYPALELTSVPKWRPIDSITIVKLNSFQLTFDLSDLARTEILARYQLAGQANGFDGTTLYFEDLFGVAPFDPVVTVPSATGASAFSTRQSRSPRLQTQVAEDARQLTATVSPDLIEAGRQFLKQSEHHPLLKRGELGIGSNWWVVAGSKTNTGNAMLANDPHLGLGIPSTFYEIHLKVESPSSSMNVSGVSYPGVPGVFLGQNERIAWGAATSYLDVIDFFAESLVIENGIPIGTLYQGGVEPLAVVPEQFRVNQVQDGIADDVIAVSPGPRPGGLDVPLATLIVPRRNNGALIAGTPTGGISLQYTGTSATRDLEGIFALARARNLDDFKQGLQFLEVGSLNWAYADVDGNIATFVNGKVPLREDLQAGRIDGLPPFFLRDGTGVFGNEWIPTNGGGSGVGYQSLPFEEMPQAVNPAQGFLVNANNDPLGITLDNNPINQPRGEGIYYLSPGFDAGFRAAKISSLLREKFENDQGHGKVSFAELQNIQSNTQMFDAEVFTPYIIRAFNSARGAGAPMELAAFTKDPAVREAVGRLSNWDFSTPTGIPEGYDGREANGGRRWPSKGEISNSTAATIYTVWRSQILANTIVATLQRVGLGDRSPLSDRMLVNLRFLLDHFPDHRGMGAAGLDFFEIPGVNAPPEIRRDTLILKSLKDALNLLAGEAFADAFGGSTNQQDYRWGKLHRITFSHPFGPLAPQLSIPTAGDFENLSAGLPGLATDGGFETIDNAPADPLGASSQAYGFSVGPARRYVGELCRHGIRSSQIIPGGESGVIGNRFYADQLSLWLTNDYHRVLFTNAEVNNCPYSKIVYKPRN